MPLRASARFVLLLYAVLTIITVGGLLEAARSQVESAPIVGPADPAHARTTHIPLADLATARDWLGTGTGFRGRLIRGTRPYWIIYKRNVSAALLDQFEIQAVAVDKRTHNAIYSYRLLRDSGAWPYFYILQFRARLWRYEAALVALYLLLIYRWGSRWAQRTYRIRQQGPRRERTRLANGFYRVAFALATLLALALAAVCAVTQDPYPGAAAAAFVLPLAAARRIARGPLRKGSEAVATGQAQPGDRQRVRTVAAAAHATYLRVATVLAAGRAVVREKYAQASAARADARAEREAKAFLDELTDDPGPPRGHAMLLYVVCDTSTHMASRMDGDALLNLLQNVVDSARAISDPDAYTVLCIIGFSDRAQVVLPLSPLSEYDGELTFRMGGEVSYAAALRCVESTIDNDVAQLTADGFELFSAVVVLLASGRRPHRDDEWQQTRSALGRSTLPPQVIAVLAGARRDAAFRVLAPLGCVLAREALADDTALRAPLKSALKAAPRATRQRRVRSTDASRAPNDGDHV